MPLPQPPAAAMDPQPPAVLLRLVNTDDGSVQLVLELCQDQVYQSDMFSGKIATDEDAAMLCSPAASIEHADGQPAAPDTSATQLVEQDALVRQHGELVAQNVRLQCLVRQYIDGISKASRKSMQEVGGVLMEGAQQRYQLALQQLHKLMAQKAAEAAAAAAALAPEAKRAAAATARAQAQRAVLLQLVADAAAAARRAAEAAPRMGVPLLPPPPSERALQHFFEVEPHQWDSLCALRAAIARLGHQLEAAEQRLRVGDELFEEAGGASGELHLVDFEQLRIESASLAAKLEARTAEVEKLRGKLVQAVQIAAHVREKLHCAELQQAALVTNVADTEGELQAARAALTVAKARHERAQRERDAVGEDWRIVTDSRCLADMQAQQIQLAHLQAQAAALQSQYEALGGGRE